MTTTKLRSTQSLYLLTTLLNFGSTPFFLVATSLTAAAFLVSSYHLIVSSVAYAAAPLFLFVTPTVTLLLCLGVVFLKHPVHNLLCLISVFFSTVVLYLYIGAEFLAFLFLIVYVGAIAILFLFVIMLLQLKVLVDLVLDRLGFSRSKPAAAIAVITVLGLNDALATSLSRFLTSGDVAVFKTVATTTEELV
jgi:NADH:ubiquinone oxidoreductase subunit 6 (subunit J)